MFKNTCIVQSPYNLFLYLLTNDLETIKNTQYFFSYTIPPMVASKLSWSCILSKEDCLGNVVKFRIKSLIKYRWKIAGTNVYAQDHMGYMQCLIGMSKYTLLEDGPQIFGRLDMKDLYSGVIYQNRLGPRRLMNIIKYGSVYGREWGRNVQCINRIITHPDDTKTKWLVNNKYTLCDIQTYWNNSSEEKKKYILNVFGLTKELVEKYRNVDTILVGDGVVEQDGITEQELIDVYTPVVQKYAKNGLLIKPHPYTVVNYKKYFPFAEIIPADIPMQLLVLLGMKCKYAITLFSSAVSLLPKETKIVWLGTECLPRLYKQMGPYPCPYDNVQIVNSSDV